MRMLELRTHAWAESSDEFGIRVRVGMGECSVLDGWEMGSRLGM
jgi:hypothetical protein